VTKLRVYAAGLLAFLIGVPLTEKAFGQIGDVIVSSIDLAGAIANSARAS
jgi:hypothetical protein